MLLLCSSLALCLLAANCQARPRDMSANDDGALAAPGKEDPSMDSKQQSPPQFPAIPPELEKILPADIVQKLKAIHADVSLGFLQKQEKIDRVMTSLPTQILDQIPAPPGFERLPEEVRGRLKQINRNKDKSWADKQKELQAYVQSLPSEQRAILMMGAPPPPNGGFGGH